MLVPEALSLILVTSVAFSAPSTAGSETHCPPLSVTVDGRSVEMPKGLGLSVSAARGGGFIVSRFNHAKTDCAAYVKLTSAITPEELEVAAYVGPDMTNVRANTSSSLGVKAYMVDVPKKIGDTISACVPQPIQHDIELNGHAVTVRILGLISGTFCGEQAQE